MSNVNIDTEVRQAIWSRRNFLKAGAGVALGTFGFAALPFISANAAPAELNVVVVGGGYGGATVAKYLKMWSKDSGLTVNVTMIEPNAEFMSPIMSGMVVTGALEVDRISFNYDRLTQVHGVEWVQDRVTAIDSEAQTVTLGDGSTTIAYDKLILSPGIDFVDIEGWDKEKIPHAWGGRDQALLLKQQLAEFPQDGTFVITVPTYPFRCPPGPYERGTSVADLLRAQGKNPRVVILDTQPDVLIRLPHEQEMFHALFDELGIEFIVNARVKSVTSGDENGEGRSITYATLIRDETGAVIGEEPDTTTISADVINLIADNKAAPLVFEAGLVPDGELWAPINPLTFESTVAGKNNIYILGDSQGSALSKAGQMANSQAKVCADAMLRTLAGEPIYQKPIFTAGGFAMLSRDKVNWISNSYRYDAEANPEEPLQRTAFKVAPEPSMDYFEPMLQWGNNLFADTWG